MSGVVHNLDRASGSAGEFGMGTAGQYGEADLKDRDFSNQVLSQVNISFSKLTGILCRRAVAPACKCLQVDPFGSRVIV